MTPQEIDELVAKVYRARLDHTCSGDAERLEKKLDAKKFQAAAEQYRPVVVEVLVQMGVIPDPRRAGVVARRANRRAAGG